VNSLISFIGSLFLKRGTQSSWS